MNNALGQLQDGLEGPPFVTNRSQPDPGSIIPPDEIRPVPRCPIVDALYAPNGEVRDGVEYEEDIQLVWNPETQQCELPEPPFDPSINLAGAVLYRNEDCPGLTEWDEITKQCI